MEKVTQTRVSIFVAFFLFILFIIHVAARWQMCFSYVSYRLTYMFLCPLPSLLFSFLLTFFVSFWFWLCETGSPSIYSSGRRVWNALCNWAGLKLAANLLPLPLPPED